MAYSKSINIHIGTVTEGFYIGLIRRGKEVKRYPVYYYYNDEECFIGYL